MSSDIPENIETLPENAPAQLNGLNPYQEQELSDVAKQQKLRRMGFTKEMSMMELYAAIKNGKQKSNI